MYGKCLVGILVLWFGMSQGQNSPCPDVFQYQRQSNGDVYGMITLPYDGSTELNLGVNASMKGYYTDNKMVKLKIKMLTPGQDIINKRTSTLNYDLYFPFQTSIPKITRITYNRKEFCSGPPEELIPGSAGVTSLWAGHNYFFNTVQPNLATNQIEEKQNQERKQFEPVLPTFTPSNETPQCGATYSLAVPLIVGGETVADGYFPWLVAMFTATDTGYQYKCTANLVSNNHVVTAARCVNFFKLQVVRTEDIVLIFGRSDLKGWVTRGAVTRGASAVRAHPDFDANSGHADVAVITLDRPVEFSTKIAPICMWEGDNDISKVVDEMGTVAGWGTDKSNHMPATYSSSVAKFIKMPVVSQSDCLYSNLSYYKLTSDVTFCAGSRDGTGVCIGDSGAGFFLNKNNRWYLRGLASIILSNGDNCDLTNFMVFCDVAKLTDWLTKTMQ